MTPDSSYTLAIKTVADLKALADADRLLKLSTEQAKKLSQAMEVLQKASDAASKSAAETARTMLARQQWLASLPEPRVIDTTNAPRRSPSSSGPTIINEVGGLASSREARINEEKQRQRARYDREDEIHRQRVQNFTANRPGAIPTKPEIEESASAIGRLSGAVGGLVGRYVSWYAAYRSVKAGLRETIGSFAEQQQAVNQLGEALVRNGTYSAAYVEQLRAMSLQYQRMTGIAQGQWLEVFSKLSQFGADSSNIEQYAGAVKSLAGIYGSLDTAVIAVQKALEGNFETFRRHGIYIDQNASQAEKMTSLMRQLATVGGGQLEAQMQGLGGAWKGLETNGHDLGVQIGSLIADSFHLEEAARAVSTAAQYWADKLRTVGTETGKVNLASARHVQSMKAQKDMARELRDDMEKLRDSYSKVTDQLNGMKSAYDAMDRAQGETEQKKKDKELAIVRDKVARRLLTEQQGLVEKAKIDEKYERMDEERRERTVRRDMALKDMELQAAMAQQATLQTQIAQAKANRVKGVEAETQKAKADGAKSALQETEKQMDNLQNELYRKMATNPAFLDTSRGQDLMAQMTHLGWKKKKQETTATEEAGKVTDLATKSKDDDARIQHLEEMLLHQKQDVEKRRFDAFNTANIGQSQLREFRNQQNQSTQTRRIGLGTDLFGANGGAPNVVLSAEQMRAQYIAQQRQVMTEFAQAMRERDAITADALLNVLQGLRLSQGDVNRLRASVTTLQRQLANRPGG